jgi:hypothetical protein
VAAFESDGDPRQFAHTNGLSSSQFMTVVAHAIGEDGASVSVVKSEEPEQAPVLQIQIEPGCLASGTFLCPVGAVSFHVNGNARVAVYVHTR